MSATHEEEAKRIMIVGSRDFPNREQVDAYLFEILSVNPEVELVSGECPDGVDAWVKEFAEDWEMSYTGFPISGEPTKDAKGKPLSFGQRAARRTIKAIQYVKQDPMGMCAVFWTGHSPGSKIAIDQCDKKGVFCYVFYPQSQEGENEPFEGHSDLLDKMDEEDRAGYISASIMASLLDNAGEPKGPVHESEVMESMETWGIPLQEGMQALADLVKDKKAVVVKNGRGDSLYCMHPDTYAQTIPSPSGVPVKAITNATEGASGQDWMGRLPRSKEGEKYLQHHSKRSYQVLENIIESFAKTRERRDRDRLGWQWNKPLYTKVKTFHLRPNLNRVDMQEYDVSGVCDCKWQENNMDHACKHKMEQQRILKAIDMGLDPFSPEGLEVEV